MKSKSLKFLFVLALGVAMLLSISACGSSASDTDTGAAATEVATEVPAATDAPAATEAAAASGDIVAAYVFTNTGTVEICSLYLSTVDTNDWGPDQLGGSTIPVGQQFTLKNIPAGKYDAKVVGCNNGGEQTLVLDIQNP